MATIALLGRCLSAAVDTPSGPGLSFGEAYDNLVECGWGDEQVSRGGEGGGHELLHTVPHLCMMFLQSWGGGGWIRGKLLSQMFGYHLRSGFGVIAPDPERSVIGHLGAAALVSWRQS
ncbi:hypothetical protein EVAR_23742_1 [Eumeta japonica]|uniref:Uncharacterized protein n=1 Tax=Eumeta variegata TaxID=151549 RepID=A0A4C1VGE1_EUMVA|nr:hypothetical protein EVAR_23742_1 [Eumeta japonica]